MLSFILGTGIALTNLVMNLAFPMPNEPPGDCTYTIQATACEATPNIILERLEILETTVQLQETEILGLRQDIGTTYVRWGRRVCPNSSELIYEGYTAKKRHNSPGGGVDFQCLPRDPEFRPNAQAGIQSGAFIMGAEYDNAGELDLWSPISRGDVPCAVCSVTGRSRQLMIPAKLSCPEEWTLEYSGLLGTDHHNHEGATYICVDSDPEIVNGNAIDDQARLYVVQAKCGSLPCDTYPDGTQVTCSVCTR